MPSRPLAGVRHRKASGGTNAKQSALLVTLIAGGLLLLLGGVAIGLLVSSRSGPRPNAVASTSRTGTLVLAWPEGQRANAALVIDGRFAGFPPTGEPRYDLPAGSHDIEIKRDGHKPFTARVVVSGGVVETVTPTFEPSSPSALQQGSPATRPNATVASAASTNFSDAGPPSTVSVRGFPGWFTSLEVARRHAAKESREIVIVFGCSDIQAATQELAQALQPPDVQNALGASVRAVIDYPRSAGARQPTAESRRLMHEFHIKRLPVLALTDERGRPYAIETRFESGFSRLAEKLDVWRKQRAERDRLLTAAEQGSETEQLAAAAAAVGWMQERGIWQFYEAEIRKWAELASRVDPANDKRLLEAFFEPQWLLEAGDTNPSDEVDVGRLVQELQPWTSRKFGNADRGAKLHLAAARLLTDAQRFDEAAAQLEHAVGYQPKDAQLAGAVRNARQFLDNRDVHGSGSGFLVSAAGHILTNQHVIAGAGPTVIRIPNPKDTLPAEIVAQDANQDLALLKINVPKAGTFTPLALKASPLRRGTAVALFGYPLGDSLGANLKFTAGRISGLPDESSNGMYLLDATVNPGSSGGPLCDQRGNVVGLVSAKTGGSTLEDSYGLAIPATKLAEFLDRHLPAAISRPLADTNESVLDWQLVDERVSGGVLMVVKKRP